MTRFQFSVKPAVVFGDNSVSSLADEIRRLGGTRVLLVTDRILSRSPVLADIRTMLEKQGLALSVYDRIPGEPATETGDECAAFGKSGGCDIVVGLGGGSTLDTAKAAAVLITNGGSVRDYQGMDKVPGPGLPKILVPTTAGTGSEVTFTAVFIRTDEKKKGGINSVHLFPESAILDPLLTLTVPPAVTATTGLDALCHALESYTSRKANFLSESVSLNAVRLIWDNLPAAFRDGSNRQARAAMLYGSFLAGVGLANAGVTAVHSISYPLGGRFGIAHGLGNGLLLPAVLEFNLPSIEKKLAVVARLTGCASTQTPDRAAAEAFTGRMKELLVALAIPRLKALNVPSSEFPSLADDALKVAVPIENNPRTITREDIIRIYETSS